VLSAWSRFCKLSSAGPGWFPGHWRQFDSQRAAFGYASGDEQRDANERALALLERQAAGGF
jgi:hypothetical protein